MKALLVNLHFHQSFFQGLTNGSMLSLNQVKLLNLIDLNKIKQYEDINEDRIKREE